MADSDIVWIAEDDRSLRRVLGEALRDAHYTVRAFASADEVLAALQQSCPAALFCDRRLGQTDGLNLITALRERDCLAPVLVISAFTDVAATAAAYRAGAVEYLAKPFDLDQAVEALRRVLLGRATEVPAAEPARHPLLGESPAMREVFRLIGRVAGSDLNVLIVGATGTGKELVARALHQESPRNAQPFVALNTAAIPAELLESELFGHEAGAFTGAQRRVPGRFEQAAGGTLFLDEIGDMPAALQTRLLRVLAGGEYYRVGGRELLRADVRLITATHQDLDAQVASGGFRADLLHRLDVVRIALPSLSMRREDIPLLAIHFLAVAAQTLKLPAKRFSGATLRRLETMDFPGNVRQIENLCQRLAVMTPGVVIQPSDLQPGSAPGAADNPEQAAWLESLRTWTEQALANGQSDLYGIAREHFDRVLFTAALETCNGHRQQAAEKLGVGRNTITRKLGSSRRRKTR